MGQQPNNYSRRTGLGCMVIFLATLLCVGGVMLGLDGLCRGSLMPQMPVYPGATVRAERHNFISSMGLGETVITLHSPDSPEVVTAWYARTIGAYLRDAARQRGARMGRSDWSVSQSEEGEGSLILLYGVCGS